MAWISRPIWNKGFDMFWGRNYLTSAELRTYIPIYRSQLYFRILKTLQAPLPEQFSPKDLHVYFIHFYDCAIFFRSVIELMQKWVKNHSLYMPCECASLFSHNLPIHETCDIRPIEKRGWAVITPLPIYDFQYMTTDNIVQQIRLNTQNVCFQIL